MTQATTKPWTLFWDMHSGGRCKEPQAKIYIQAPEDEACVIFYNRFGHSPHRVTCTCCGEDYSVSESPTLEAASAYHRGCGWGDNGYEEAPDKGFRGKDYKTLDEYIKQSDVLVIRDEEIKPEERSGRVPRQGYVWME